ncbi:hypothetical protein [Campylobacter sp. JMF_03 NE3]|uniref:hypothetical protein n=1 Tax=Campylobacter sp. JMF_03 NE3 TaxID=2983831 RepID=UPI0022E9B48C|nr:hypothetical protein [Campylobacter sp. JMF_03 NE3]MDA3053576.1 hypothetical protein [Campylobacter sp. JMF_03 NE3]
MIKKDRLEKLVEILLDDKCNNNGIVNTAKFLLDKGFIEKELKDFFSSDFLKIAKSKGILNS